MSGRSGHDKSVHQWTQIGTPFAKQFIKGMKEVSGKSLIIITEKRVRQHGAKKPSESQRAKAAKDREEDFYDQARKDNILGRNQARQELWREHLKDTIEALDKALKYLEKQYQT